MSKGERSLLADEKEGRISRKPLGRTYLKTEYAIYFVHILRMAILLLLLFHMDNVCNNGTE